VTLLGPQDRGDDEESIPATLTPQLKRHSGDDEPLASGAEARDRDRGQAGNEEESIPATPTPQLKRHSDDDEPLASGAEARDRDQATPSLVSGRPGVPFGK
jgi:hypothetical protein